MQTTPTTPSIEQFSSGKNDDDDDDDDDYISK